MQRVTVVIPYYQRASGILTRALRSIAAQRRTAPLTVMVVDDESPRPACLDVAEVALPADIEVRILQRRNGGPGAARNAALDAAPADTRWIAFLDSDDTWMPDHLERALAALATGGELYFANHLELGAQKDAFARRLTSVDELIRASRRLALPDAYAFDGDMVERILAGNLIETSTVVYDFQRLGHLRFDTSLREAFEDHLFWLEAARLPARFVYSTRVAVHYGAGINLFRNASWGTEPGLKRVISATAFRRRLLEGFPLTAPQRELVERELEDDRRSFVTEVLHRVVRGRGVPLRLLRRQFASDRRSLWYFVPPTVDVALTRRAGAR